MSNLAAGGASTANTTSPTNSTTTTTNTNAKGMDASKLNHTPAPLPPSPEGPSSPPLRDASNPFSTANPFAAGGGGGGGHGGHGGNGAHANHGNGNGHGGGNGGLVGGDGTGASAYLEEAPQHPTVAETGALGTSPQDGPGPRFGQLKRRDSDAKRRIIRLASFGGEGLTAKPPIASPPEDETGAA